MVSEDITDTAPGYTGANRAAEEMRQMEQSRIDTGVPEQPQVVAPSKICIVGFADGHRDKAPWDTPDMEFWGINRLHQVLPGKTWHRWFELHDLEKFYTDDHDHQRFLKQAKFPIYVRPQDLELALSWGWNTAQPYPVTQVVKSFGPYFTNTVSWLIALAIVANPEELHIYGVDMAQDSLTHAEYSEQRPSCEWLIGVAQGRGINVVIPEGSDLLKASHLYGFDDEQHRAKLMSRLNELGVRKEQIRGEMVQAQSKATWMQARISELDGAMQEVQYNLRNLVTPAAEPFNIPPEVPDAL